MDILLPTSSCYAVKGENGEGTLYEYDTDGGIERRFYDAAGNMIKQVLPESYNADMDDGEGHQYVYDKASRLIQIQNHTMMLF